VYAVTPADITRMMNTYLREGDMTIAIAGDVTKIKAQVEPFGQVLTD
jgi:predicted Zn-dependent peptidase